MPPNRNKEKSDISTKNLGRKRRNERSLTKSPKQRLSKVTKTNEIAETKVVKRTKSTPKGENIRKVVLKDDKNNNVTVSVESHEEKANKTKPKVRSKVITVRQVDCMDTTNNENDNVIAKAVNIDVEGHEIHDEEDMEDQFIPDYEDSFREDGEIEESEGDETEYEDDDEDSEARIKKVKRKEPTKAEIEEEERQIRENPAIMNVLKKMVEETLKKEVQTTEVEEDKNSSKGNKDSKTSGNVTCRSMLVDGEIIVTIRYNNLCTCSGSARYKQR